MFENKVFLPADILLPKNADMEKWSTVACDQFTSQPEYWDAVDEFVGQEPSTLRLMIPEAYFGLRDVPAEIEKVNANMARYMEQGILETVPDSFVYVERQIADGRIRRGLVGKLDLEAYDFHPEVDALVKASENTVVSRLPPRIKIRKAAPVEMPHVMVLIDDPEKTVVEPLNAKKAELETLYDFELMQEGGRITGRRVSGSLAQEVVDALSALGAQDKFEARYGMADKPLVLFAVGDGNHSLATAKACWEELKPSLSAEEREKHPARWALVEVVNIHDEALDFEPIHRVVFNVEPEKLLADFLAAAPEVTQGEGEGYPVECAFGGKRVDLKVQGISTAHVIAVLQNFLEGYVEDLEKIDYIHGDADTRELADKPGNIGFLLPAMEKSDLFRAVVSGAVFPKKSFSMGHARDKRYYLECRKIV